MWTKNAREQILFQIEQKSCKWNEKYSQWKLLSCTATSELLLSCMAFNVLAWSYMAFHGIVRPFHGPVWPFMILHSLFMVLHIAYSYCGLLWLFAEKHWFYGNFIVFSCGYRSKLSWSCYLSKSNSLVDHKWNIFFSKNNKIYLKTVHHQRK